LNKHFLFLFYLAGTTRLYRGVNICHSNTNNLTLKRCLSNTSNNKKGTDLGIDKSSYKPSTISKAQKIPNDLKGGQPQETIDSTPKITATLTGGGKVWSVQNPGSVHVAPLAAATTTFVPTSSDDAKTIHETTVYTTQGQLNFADPSKTHILKPEATPAQLAEAAAASAFEPFSPATSPTDTVFAPKISSTDIYSSASSPTGQYENATPSTIHGSTDYESTYQSEVFGGTDTSASDKQHPTENLYKAKQTGQTRQEIILQIKNSLRYFFIVVFMKFLFHVKVIYVMKYFVNHLNMSMKKVGQWMLYVLVCFFLFE
jgi:hypothetical protein